MNTITVMTSGAPAAGSARHWPSFLARAHEDGRQEWHWAVGDLRQAMHAALLALDAIDAAAFDDDPDDAEDDPAADAAEAISDVGAEIEQLWHALMHSKGQGDD